MIEPKTRYRIVFDDMAEMLGMLHPHLRALSFSVSFEAESLDAAVEYAEQSLEVVGLPTMRRWHVEPVIDGSP